MNLLDLTPLVRAEAVEGERVVLIRPPPRRRGVLRPLEWVLFWMAPKRLKLDDVGSTCWRLIDGKRTAREIALEVRERHGEEAEPAEERVGRFLSSLRREELVLLKEVDDGG